MRDFKYTACNNEKCIDRNNCKRYLMYKLYRAKDIKTGGGTPEKHCERFLRNVT